MAALVFDVGAASRLEVARLPVRGEDWAVLVDLDEMDVLEAEPSAVTAAPRVPDVELVMDAVRVELEGAIELVAVLPPIGVRSTGARRGPVAAPPAPVVVSVIGRGPTTPPPPPIPPPPGPLPNPDRPVPGALRPWPREPSCRAASVKPPRPASSMRPP